MRVAALAAVVLCLAATARAEEPEGPPDWLKALRVRGRVAEEFAYRLLDPGDVSKLRTTGWLEGKYTFSDAVNLRVATRGWYDAVFDATGRYPPNVERDQRTQFDLREAILSVSRGELDIRAGRQQIVWGEAISSFVTDVVNPRDFTEFILPDFNELRIPIWAVDVTYRLGPNVNIEAVWTPDTRLNKFPKQGAEFQFAPIPYRFHNPVVRLPDNPDEFDVARSEGGFRLSALLNGWDASLIYYDQADKTPVFFQSRVSQAFGPDVIVLDPGHPRLHIVGATLAKSFEPVVLRSEVAFTIGKSYSSTNPLEPDGVARRDTIDYLVSADYTFFSQVDATVQFSQKILTGSANNLTYGSVEGRVTTSVAARLTTGFFENTLNPAVLFIVNVNRGDYRVSPRIDFLLTGSVTLSVGADVFAGQRQTLYGQFKDTDRLWATTTWRF